MPLRIALVGNPNCGKTTLFNRLTGSSARVGNWPGVTVERREGVWRGGTERVAVVDLPGTYSASPRSPEERVARGYVLGGEPDLIVNVVDVTDLERSLYLTAELLETDCPLLLALNMMDRARREGIRVEPERLERALGVPAVPISAAKGTGLHDLMRRAVSAARAGRRARSLLEGAPVFAAVSRMAESLRADGISHPLFRAAKAVEGDGELRTLPLPAGALRRLSREAQAARALCPGGDAQTELTSLRYRRIAAICAQAAASPRPPLSSTRSDRIDRVLLHRIFAFPILLLLLGAAFFLTFGSVGGIAMPGVWLRRLAQGWVDRAARALSALMTSLGAAPGGFAHGLAVRGVCGGVGAVLSFLPQVLVLFFLFSLLEGSGYLARAAFLSDRALRRFGLSGKSFVPMLMGFGCSVPALLASRTVESERSRRLTMLLTPFFSCSGKLPVYVLFAGAFFPGREWAVVSGIYLLGILTAACSGALLSRTAVRGNGAPFVLELPAYRLPSLRAAAAALAERTRHFLLRAATAILTATAAVWLLQSFDLRLRPVSDGAQSILGAIGRAAAPVFAPLGFGTWQAASAVLSGAVAKEMTVSTLGVLYGGGFAAAFTPASALSFLVFTLLAPPCSAAVSALWHESRSGAWTAFALLYQLAAAWSCSFLVYTAARLLG